MMHGWMNRAMRRLGYVPARPRAAYQAGQVTRLTQDWVWSPLSQNAELRPTLRTMRARSRELSQNNDHARKFLKMVVDNVVGPSGLTFQSVVKEPSGQADVLANRRIEEAFAAWSKKGQFDVTGCLSRRDGERLLIESIARDGEVLIRKVRGFDNRFRFALQFIEVDQLDDTYTQAPLPNGNEVVMGVERDPWHRPVAYHLLKSHPGDAWIGFVNRERERVPAEDMLHLFLCERVGQARGVPWMHAAMWRLNMLRGYEEAELVGARAAACQMGFFTSPLGDEYTGEAVDGSGQLITEAEPGTFQRLPAGVDFKSFTPDRPSGTFDKFMKSALRGIAAGLLVSYNALAEDLEGVNYSSIRAGLLAERDMWRLYQGWLIEACHLPLYREWLEFALLSGALNLPPSKLEKFHAPKFQPRGWTWVDPENETNAKVREIQNGLGTRTAALAERGLDFEETIEQLVEEEALIARAGLHFEAPQAPAPPPSAPLRREEEREARAARNGHAHLQEVED